MTPQETIRTPAPEMPRQRFLGRWTDRWGTSGALAAVVLAVLFFLAICAPWVVPGNANDQNLADTLVGPSGAHWLGADGQGRDVLARLLLSARPSLFGPLIVISFATIAGTALAFVAAWRGGLIDRVFGVVANATLAFPSLLLAILFVAVLGKGFTTVLIVLTISYIPYMFRLFRGVAAKEMSEEYVAALKVQGAGSSSICLRHVLPNMTGIIAAQASVGFGSALIDIAGMSFIGLGVQPPGSDWGSGVADNLTALTSGSPLPASASGACIVVAVVAANVLGDRLSVWMERH